MIYRELTLTYVMAFLRLVTIAAITVASAIGSGRDSSWQTGTFHFEGADDEGWKGSGVSAARHAPGNPSTNPLNETVFFDITAESGIYRAAITGLLIDESVTYDELFPWLRNMPSQVKFRIKRKTLYFRDFKNAQHKAEILEVRKPGAIRGG